MCLSYAGCCKKRASKRPLTAQVRSACRHQHHPVLRWAVEPQPPEPHFPSCPLPGHGLLFKTKLERSLAWKGAQPRGCRNHSRLGLENQVSPEAGAVPLPKRAAVAPCATLRPAAEASTHVPLKERLTQGTSCYFTRKVKLVFLQPMLGARRCCTEEQAPRLTCPSSQPACVQDEQ